MTLEDTLVHRELGANSLDALALWLVCGCAPELALGLPTPRPTMPPPYRVLLANEDLLERCALTALLCDAGYDTTAAATFEEARSALDRGAPDLLMAHLRLGAFNGLHLFLRGRAEKPDMAAIITTGPEDVDIKMEAMQFGVLCVLTRVVTRDFLPTIAKLIERRGSPAWH